MAINSSSIPVQPLNKSRQPEAPSRSDWFEKAANESWKLLAVPLLLFIAIPVLALFLHTSAADFYRI